MMVLAKLLGLLLITFFSTSGISCQNCDQNFTVPVGQISSPNFPSYPLVSGTVCRYRIIAPHGDHIQLNFLPHPQLNWNTNCNDGNLRVFEGENPDLKVNNSSAQYCNLRQTCHKSYLSHGNALLLIYNNKYFLSSIRFKLLFRFTSGLNMVYNNTEGLIYSPNFMNKLLNTSKTYTYRIEADAGMRVYLSFSYINFHDDVNCSKTSLTIYEGADTSGIPKGKRCGRNSSEFLSASNVITLKYKTSADTSSFLADHGFIVYYSSGPQGCSKFYSSKFQIIYSPLYPRNYPNNTKCTYNITVEKGSMISLRRRSYSVHSGDTLEAFEKDPANGHLTKRNLTLFSYYTILSNSIQLKFKSDGRDTSPGFMLYYVAPIGCNVTVTSIGSYLTSPTYPSNYPNNIVCNYIFKYPRSDRRRAAISISDLDIEDSEYCENDSLSIYDGSNASAPLLDRLCGFLDNMHKFYTASGDTLFVQFKTNKANSRRGFEAMFIDGAFSSPPDQEFRSKTETIVSPNYPNRYPNETSFKYSIISSYGNIIILKMQQFDVESSKNCTKDSLKIYEKSISNETLMSTRCGKDTSRYVSRSNKTYLIFKSDSSISRRGFRITFTSCGGFYSYESNRYYGQYTILSPGYPESYPTDSICRYELRGRMKDFGVRMEFIKFELENSHGCQNDNLTIYEGGEMTSSNITAIKCGIVTRDFFSKSPNVIAVFRSNSYINKKGFRINVDLCSKLFTNETGVVTSPGFPLRHPQRIRCTYAIRLRKGANIQLVFQNFSLFEYAGNYLKLYDGRTSPPRLVETIYGSRYYSFLAPGNELFMEFQSYAYNPGDPKWYGFKLRYFDNQGFCAKHRPCKNSATCIDLTGDYKCNCSGYYIGKNCSEKIMPCKSNPCLNKGLCSNIYSDESPKFNCTCPDGYDGKTCENRVGFCAKHRPCKNSAICIDLTGDYKCNCSGYYIGKNCSEKIMPCKSNPCLNEGLCSNIYSDESSKFNCTCPDGYDGKTCENRVDNKSSDSDAYGGIILIVSVTVGAVFIIVVVIFIVICLLKKQNRNSVKHIDVSAMPAASFDNQAYAGKTK